MSQPSVTAFFHTRKRQATDELRNKSKVLILDREKRQIEVSKLNNDIKKIESTNLNDGTSPKLLFTDNKSEKLSNAVRNIQFDVKPSSSPSSSSSSSSSASARPIKMITRARATRTRKLSAQEGQQDIRESFLKINEVSEQKNVPFEKKGTLSPRKTHQIKHDLEKVPEEPAVGSTTPKKSGNFEKIGRQDLDLAEIKNRINKSSRLAELKASIDRIKKCEEKLKDLQKGDAKPLHLKAEGEGAREGEGEVKPPKIKKFEKIELEVPVSPQKMRSPMKTPTKSMRTISSEMTSSPQRRLLFSPKEKTPSPVKSSPTKAPAYQRYQSIVDTSTPALPLPFNYRFLAEAFRCVDTVAAMLFNRKETITFKKLKPAVQELLRRNFTLEHLAQMQGVWPEAYELTQVKMRSFGSSSKQEKYELVLTPKVEEKSGRNTPDDNDVLKSAAQMSMAPAVLLERRRKFYNCLLERVKDEHEKFLLGLESPMVIPKHKITRWHPEFDVEGCKEIEGAELPQPPNVEKASSAHDVLEKAKTLFNCNTRMEKALQRLAEAKMTTKSELSPNMNEVQTQTDENKNIDITVVDTPPDTPTVEKKALINPLLKGIPKALLEKVRAKQAAKALEAMTRTANEDKEAALYARLPEMSKILRNIFVAEKKGVLTLEFVIQKLDNSYRTKLTQAELEEHVKLMCKLLPTWASIHNVRKTNYLKIVKDIDIGKVVKRFEIMANDKVKG